MPGRPLPEEYTKENLGLLEKGVANMAHLIGVIKKSGINPVVCINTFHTDGMGAAQWPGLHQPVMTRIGYHLRAGKHDVTNYDWDQFIKFADRHMPKR